MGTAGGLYNSATTHAQNKGYELAHQTSTHLWFAVAREGAGSADPKLQDLHNTGRQ